VTKVSSKEGLSQFLPAHPQRLVVHFHRFGPYHVARLASAREALEPQGWDVVGLELASVDATYAWQGSWEDTTRQRVTVFPGRCTEQIPASEIRQGVARVLNRLQPKAIAIAGWAQLDALTCLRWCRRHGARSILMSETREADGERRWWKESLKSLRVRSFDAALVGAKSHHTYVRRLGFKGPVSLGYDVVDNGFFTSRAHHWRAAESGLGHQPRPYLLASNRFVERKNLVKLIEAFAQVSQSIAPDALPDLCLLGDGEQRHALEVLASKAGLRIVQAAPWDNTAQSGLSTGPRVLFPGFRQIEELPRFYAHALALVHPAFAEPWGLVINEAMAAELPILSSSNVGAAEELLVEGINGYSFDPSNVASISQALRRLLALSKEQQRQMGQTSRQLLQARCPTSSFGLGLSSLLHLS
jgi:1,2-diacylglycerol 3-alpha-glucosyltransferase